MSGYETDALLVKIGDITYVHYRDEVVVNININATGSWAGLAIKAKVLSQNEDKILIIRKLERLTPDTLNIVIDTAAIPDGRYFLRLELIDSTDKTDKRYRIISSEKKEFSINKFPRSTKSARVYINENNALVVDGQLFFPIMSYAVTAGTKAFKELEEVGFNTVIGPHTTANNPFIAEQIKEYLYIASKAKLKVMSTAASYVWGSPPQLSCPTPETVISKFKDHPSLLGWFTGDEIFANRVSVEQMDKLYKIIRKRDPDHPVGLNLMKADVDYFPGVTSVSDIVSFDWYPIPNTSLSSYADLIAQLKRRVASRKPVWVWLQLSLKGERARDPSPQELRCMTWLVIAHGAKGIGYFIYSANISPESKKALRKIISEVSCLAPVILSSPSGEKVTVQRVKGSGQVDILFREHEGKGYLIAVNKSEMSVDVRFMLPEHFVGKEVKVLFENRNIKQDGHFYDRFVAHDVHIYEWEARS
ncbi:MAG: beta-galactosidase [bacterium]|nr:beta-galactosidase [bacterium]